MSGSTQDLMQQALAMLGSAPRTAENLNRAMLAITRGEAAPADGFDMNAQVDRMIDRSTPRRANVPRNTQPNAPVGVQTGTITPVAPAAARGTGFAETAPALAAEPIAAIPEEEALRTYDPYQRGPMNEMPPAPSRGERMINSQANMRRRGTINAAQPIVEEDPTSGMFEGTQTRQAVDTEDPMNIALGLGALPLAGVAAGAAMPMTLGQRAYAAVQADRAARAAQAARTADTPARQASRALAQRTRNAVQESSTQRGTVDRAGIEASRRGAGVKQ